MKPGGIGVVTIEQGAEPPDHDAGIAIDCRIEIFAAAECLGRDGIGFGRTASTAKAMFDQKLQQAR